MAWIIYKASRAPGAPYAGPACDEAGVEPGKVYATREEAEADRQKLCQMNPVGFRLYELLEPAERIQVLEAIVRELHWMARRYADNRSTYATSMFNELTRRLQDLDVQLNLVDGTPFARDAMGRQYDGLSNAEAAIPLDTAREPETSGVDAGL